ncbi:MAG: PaREP1 family protein [Nitrososphaerales archaeon]
MVKAVAEKKGKHLRTHGGLWDFVRELDMENPEWGLRYLFLQASALHSNFYEDKLPGWAVESRAEPVRAFIEKMKSLL